MQNVCPVGLFYFFFQIHKILHSLRSKKCELKSFQFNLQAFDKYLHTNGRHGLKKF